MPIYDGHLDLAMNAMEYNRDLTWSLDRLRAYEEPVQGQDDRGWCTVTLEAMRQGGVRWCTGTLFSRAKPGATAAKCFLRSDADSASPTLAMARAQGQLAYYRLLHEQGLLQLVTRKAELTQSANNSVAAVPPIQIVLLMEGADPLRTPDDLAWWCKQGLRALGLTHTTANAYATGNQGDGSLTNLGKQLLREMHHQGVALDLSHLCDASFHDALEHYDGSVFASHSNCRSICPGKRQISDQMIRQIIQRQGVIGVVLHNPMITPNQSPETYRRQDTALDHLVMHIDHICQLAGNARHVAIGSDLDGGFGREHTPMGVDNIADLNLLIPLLRSQGYSESDTMRIMCGNWLDFWNNTLPQ